MELIVLGRDKRAVGNVRWHRHVLFDWNKRPEDAARGEWPNRFRLSMLSCSIQLAKRLSERVDAKRPGRSRRRCR